MKPQLVIQLLSKLQLLCDHTAVSLIVILQVRVVELRWKHGHGFFKRSDELSGFCERDGDASVPDGVSLTAAKFPSKRNGKLQLEAGAMATRLLGVQ